MLSDWLNDDNDEQDSLEDIYEKAKGNEIVHPNNFADEIEREYKQEIIRPLFYKGFMNVANKRYYNTSRIVYVEVDENGRSKILLDDGNITSCSASAKTVIDLLHEELNKNGEENE